MLGGNNAVPPGNVLIISWRGMIIPVESPESTLCSLIETNVGIHICLTKLNIKEIEMNLTRSQIGGTPNHGLLISIFVIAFLASTGTGNIARLLADQQVVIDAFLGTTL